MIYIVSARLSWRTEKVNSFISLTYKRLCFNRSWEKLIRKRTNEGNAVVLPESASKENKFETSLDSCMNSEATSDPMDKHMFFLLRNIATISDILEALYKSPNHGNKFDPMDELVYIHLSKKTNELSYVDAYDRLSSAFPNWEGLAEADPRYVEGLIASAGLGNQRTAELIENVKAIRAKFGKARLDTLQNWPEARIFKFLTSLKGIGPKSALCVMLYSLGKKVFPVDTHVHVICERMGFIKKGLDHDQAQRELSQLFPRELRYDLHVNMVAHGREICRRRGKPLCELCNLSKFCLYFRNNQKDLKGFSMIDIFCGAGGATLGLKNAGFSVKLAVDNDRKATDTYYLNNEYLSFDRVITCDIRSIDDDFLKNIVQEKICLVFGGPPCQGWSHIGKNRKNGTNGTDFFRDEKNTLYKELIRQLDVFEPKYFVMENVPGLLSAHNGKYAEIMRDEFRNHKYELLTVELNASDYGIAQNRRRVFFIGRRVYPEDGSVPAREELAKIETNLKGRAQPTLLSFRDVTKGLPNLKHGEGRNVLRNGNNPIAPGSRPNLIFNHFTRKHNSRDLKIYELLSEGEDYADFSKEKREDELLPYSTDSFKTKFRKIKGNDKCYTIISHLSKDANSYIHPDDNRGITVREAARVQSFPDDFIFLPKGFSQFINLGNAVPPKLAEVIGKSIIEVAGLEKD